MKKSDTDREKVCARFIKAVPQLLMNVQMISYWCPRGKVVMSRRMNSLLVLLMLNPNGKLVVVVQAKNAKGSTGPSEMANME